MHSHDAQPGRFPLFPYARLGLAFAGLLVATTGFAQGKDRQVNGFAEFVSTAGEAKEVPSHFSYRCSDRSCIERSTNGTQAFTWKTAPVRFADAASANTAGAADGTVTFQFGVSMTGPGKSKPSEHQILLDGKPLVKLTIPVDGDAIWKQGDATLRFDYLCADIYDDLEGVMYLTVPARMLAPGKPALLTAQGLASGTSCFLFVSAIPDVVEDPAAHPADNPTRYVRPQPITADQMQFDGRGQFQLFRRPDNTQGLETLLSRGRVKPDELVARTGGEWRYACERTIFRDEFTGAEVWRMTNDTRGGVRHGYSAFPAWNANGRLIKLNRAGLPCYLDQEKCTASTPLPPVGGEWSSTEPNILFTQGEWNGKGAIVAYDLIQRKAVRGLGPTRGYTGVSPVSPDGKWVCWREGIQDDATTFGLAAADGSSYKSISVAGGIVTEQTPVTFAMPGPQPKVADTKGGVHQMYFTRRPDHSLAVSTNCWNPRLFVTRIITPDGKLQKIIPEDLSHQSWDPQGKRLIYAGSGLTGYDVATGRSYRIVDVRESIEGHTTWTGYDPNWAGASVRSPFAGEILRVSMRPDHSVARLCGSCPINPNNTNYDTDEFACQSPDATKMIFMSTLSGTVNEYIVVAGNPRPPKLKGEWAAGGYRLSWTPDALSRETKGYRIYRTARTGEGYREIAGPVEGTTTLVKDVKRGQPAFFAVRAQEWSGLISRYSNEVSAAGAATTSFIEAEAGSFAGFKQGFDPQGAGDLYYLFVPVQGIRCSVTLPGSAKPQQVWARVAGKGVSFSAAAGGKRVAVAKKSYAGWTWVNLGALRGPITITSDSAWFKLDRIVCTPGKLAPAVFAGASRMGPDYAPNRAFQALAPAGVTAAGKTPFTATVSWQPVPGARYYNVYAAGTPGFTPAQANLLYSPPAGTEQTLDWGLKPGATTYYKVVAVDYDGTASQPSAPAELKTQALPVQTLNLEYEAGDLADGAAVEEEPSASGGKDVLLKKGQSWTLKVTVPAEGDYVFWHRYRGNSGGEVKGEILVDGKQHLWTENYDQANLGGGLAGHDWVWDRWAFASWSADPNGILHLSAGEHTIRMKIEGPLHLDRLVITNDQSWVPEGKLCSL